MKKTAAILLCLTIFISFLSGCSNKNDPVKYNTNYDLYEYGLMPDDTFMLTTQINALDGINDSDIYVYDNYVAVRLKTDKDKLGTDFRTRIEKIIKDYYPHIKTVDIIY